MKSFEPIAFGLLAGLVLTATSGVAIADDWVAEKLRGSVLAFEAGEWVPLHRGDIVSDDRYVKTLGDGRVQFVRGEETIDLGGHTLVQILDRDGQQFTNIHQHYGKVEVEVEKRDVNHFAIVTRYLSTMVKGTHFVVNSGSTGASVSVDQGQVQVSQSGTGTNVDISPGQSVSVSATGFLTVSATGGTELPIIRNPDGAAVEQGNATKSEGASGRRTIDGEGVSDARYDPPGRSMPAGNPPGNGNGAHGSSGPSANSSNDTGNTGANKDEHGRGNENAASEKGRGKPD